MRDLLQFAGDGKYGDFTTSDKSCHTPSAHATEITLMTMARTREALSRERRGDGLAPAMRASVACVVASLRSASSMLKRMPHAQWTAIFWAS